MWTKKIAAVVYAAIAYAAFFGSILYMIGFVAGFGVPKGVNDGPSGPVTAAIFIDVGLILLFVAQHTVMARPAFKRRWIQMVPKPVERSTYVLASSVILLLAMWQWRPIPGTVWRIENPAGRDLIYTAYGLGWFLVFYSSFLINHFDLFGLRQVFLYLKGKAYTPVQLKVVSLYHLVRNPLMLGFLIAFWAAPEMTYSRLLFAVCMTGYTLMGIYFEERTLSAELGETYRAYRKRTPMLIPVPVAHRSRVAEPVDGAVSQSGDRR